MSPIHRGLGAAALGLVLVSVLGCTEDNEKVAKITSTPPPAGAAAPPRSVEEYAKRSAGQNKNMYQGGGYPGMQKR